MSEIKYKLLKELPFCPIGTIGKFNGNCLEINHNYCFEDSELPELIEQGWIEEYKPKSQEEIFKELISYNIENEKIQNKSFNDNIKLLINKYEIKEK